MNIYTYLFKAVCFLSDIACYGRSEGFIHMGVYNFLFIYLLCVFFLMYHQQFFIVCIVFFNYILFLSDFFIYFFITLSICLFLSFLSSFYIVKLIVFVDFWCFCFCGVTCCCYKHFLGILLPILLSFQFFHYTGTYVQCLCLNYFIFVFWCLSLVTVCFS